MPDIFIIKRFDPILCTWLNIDHLQSDDKGYLENYLETIVPEKRRDDYRVFDMPAEPPKPAPQLIAPAPAISPLLESVRKILSQRFPIHADNFRVEQGSDNGLILVKKTTGERINAGKSVQEFILKLNGLAHTDLDGVTYGVGPQTYPRDDR